MWGAPAVCKILSDMKAKNQQNAKNVEMIRNYNPTIPETLDEETNSEDMSTENHSLLTQSLDPSTPKIHARTRRAFSAPLRQTHKERRAMELQAHAQRVEEHLVPAIRSFFRSIMVILTKTDQRRRLVSNVLQDMLRILTLWFDYGDLPIVAEVMQEGLQQINIHTSGYM